MRERVTARTAWVAVAIGASASALALVVGAIAYRGSASALRAATFRHHLDLARLLATLPGSDAPGPLEPKLGAIGRAFAVADGGAPGRFACVIGPDARLWMNTRRPAAAGQFVGNVALPGGAGPATVGGLVRARADWVGVNVNHAGMRQLAAYAYSPALGAHVAVHAPADAMEAHVRAVALPWAVGLALVSLGLIPGSVGLLGWAYARMRRAARAARTDVAARDSLLERAHGAATFGLVARGLAHDFNNLLTAIAGHARLGAAATDPAAHFAEIAAAAARGRALVGELDLAERVRPAPRTRLAVSALADDTLRTIRPCLPLEVQVRRRLATGGADAVRASPEAIRRIVLNLCLNAVAAMDGRPGVLDVAVDVEEIQVARAVTRGRLDPGSFVRLTVRDTGRGMAEDFVRRAFDPYVTAGPHAGTGLGLAVVDRLVAALGGAIEVVSVPGAGTMVRVYWPRDTGDGAGAEAERAGPGGSA